MGAMLEARIAYSLGTNPSDCLTIMIVTRIRLEYAPANNQPGQTVGLAPSAHLSSQPSKPSPWLTLAGLANLCNLSSLDNLEHLASQLA